MGRKGRILQLQMPFVLKQHTMNERLHKKTSSAIGNKFAVSNTHHGTPGHSSHAYAGVPVLSSLHPFLRNPAFCVLPVPGVMEMRWVSPEKSPLGPFAHTSGLKSRKEEVASRMLVCVCVRSKAVAYLNCAYERCIYSYSFPYTVLYPSCSTVSDHRKRNKKILYSMTCGGN